MSMIFDVQSGGGIPAGIYRVKFLGVTPTTHEEYGVGARFDFEVLDGQQKGETTSRITSPKPTPRNACGRVISGLTGRAVEAGQRIDLAPYVGMDYLVQVELAASGTATRVAAVMPGTWAQQGFAAPASPQPTGGIPSRNTPSPTPVPASVPAGVSVVAPAEPARGPGLPPAMNAVEESELDPWERF